MIEIKTEKVVNSNGGLYRELKSFSLLKKDELPEKYLIGNKVVYQEDKTLCLIGFNSTGWKIYEQGDRLRERVFQELLNHIVECGKILQKINRELLKLKATWRGNVTFLI